MCRAKKKKGGYIHLYGQVKHNGSLRSCLHDAVLNACTYIDVELTKQQVYKKRPPRRTIDTSLLELIQALEDKIGFTRDMASFSHMFGGIELNLIKCTDAKIRLIVAKVEDVEETTVHAFIHVAKKLEKINEPHVAALVDNRKTAPVCLIQNRDGKDKIAARRVFINFFSDGKAKVQITDIYVLTKVHSIDS